MVRHYFCHQKLFIILILVLIIFTHWNAPAQEKDNFFANYKIQNWSTKDGMTVSSVTDIIQSRSGYIYFGTYDGLVRFDGIKFTTINRATNPKYNFLSVRCLFQDKLGNIWVGSNDNGVCKIMTNMETKSFTVDDGLPNNSIRALAQDRDGNVWVGTAGGVAYIDPTEKIVNPKGLENYDADKIIITGIYCDTYGNTFVMGATENSLYIYTDLVTKEMTRNVTSKDPIMPPGVNNAATKTTKIQIKNSGEKAFVQYKAFESFPKAVVTTMGQDHLGRYIFGIMPHYVVILNANPGLPNQSETVYDVGQGVQQATTVNSIMQDNKSNIWVSTNKGVAVFHGKSVVSGDRHKFSLSFYDSSNGLKDDNVNKIIQDMEDNIWFATDSNGIDKVSLSKFRSVPLDAVVNAIVQDKKRNVVWVASDDGVHCFDKNINEVENFVTKYCRYTRVRDVAMTSNSDLLVSTYQKFGLLKFSGNFTHSTANNMKDSPPPSVKSWNKDNGLLGNKTRCAIELANGDIYCGTTTGLCIIKKLPITTGTDVIQTSKVTSNGVNHTITVRKTPGNNNLITIDQKDGLPNEYIMCAYQDTSGLVWLGTDGGGIFTIDPVTLVIKNIYQSSTDPTSLSSNIVFKIMELQKNEIWICTGSGLSRFDDGKFFNVNSSNGLGVNGVFQLLVDYTDRVWATSNRGLSSIKLQALENLCNGKTTNINPQFFSQSDGLSTRGVTSTSKSCKDRLGRLWFTMVDGIVIYDPSKTVSNRAVPLTKIETVAVDSNRSTFQDSAVTLSPGNRRLDIKYTGLSFLSTEQLMFQYQLIGFDETPSEWTYNRQVSYTNLKPGRYTFTVKTKTNNDIESPPSTPLIITKIPYFWQISYFWLVMMANAILLTVIVIIKRFQAAFFYQKMLENEIEKKTHELLKKNADLEKEKQKSESLLLNILPKSIAQELTLRPDQIIADNYNNVTVLFADIVGFTKLSSGLDASEVVTMLNALFTKFDMRAKSESIEKIKTIGDCYMAACGLSYDANPLECCRKMIDYAKGMIEDINDYNACAVGTPPVRVQMRIGINIGSLVAGVIGKTKFIYDIWGDTVNVASRMESTSEPLQIHVSEDVYSICRDIYQFDGPFSISIKGKGTMETYFVE